MEKEEHTDDEPLVEEKSEFEDIIDQKLYDAGVYIMHGEVTEQSSLHAARVLEAMATEVPKHEIVVILNSVGGEIFPGLLVFDTIRSIIKRGISVTVEVRGLAASMGVTILQAGSRRLASKYTRFMIHEVSEYLSTGKATEQEEQVAELRKCNDMLRDILVQTTGKSSQEIENLWKKTDVWMNSEQALAFGLIDQIT